ncbi:MAG: flagellar biosynthetic protein FliR [Thermodesulfovibrionales bacterium]|nr:flagellar biosynthetic protein FliR [Thermodesulfovibrionales bacterium]
MLSELSLKYLPIFLFILLRTSIVMSFLPVFSSKSLPAQFKIGFIIAIALILTPIVEMESINLSELPFYVIQEVLFGIALGSVARAIFMAVEMAGQIISNAMGLSIATVFNPEIGQSTEIGRLYSLIAITIFLATDIHHVFIYVLVKSYELLPAGSINADNLITRLITGGAKLFVLAFKLSAPVLLVMFVLNIVFGFLYRAAPQINIFFTTYPIFIFVGLMVMLLSLPFFINALVQNFGELRNELDRVLSMGRG